MNPSAARPLPHAGDHRPGEPPRLPAPAPDATALGAMRARAALLPDSDWLPMAVFGPDAADYLHRRLTQSIRSLPVGAAAHALQLGGDGRMQGDLLVYRRGEAEFTVLAQRRFAEGVFELLEKYILMDRVEMAKTRTGRSMTMLLGPSSPDALVAIGGPGAAPFLKPDGPAVLGPLEIEGTSLEVFRDVRWGVPCFHLSLAKEGSAALAARIQGTIESGAATLASPAAVEYFRIAQGVPLFGADTTQDTIPLEANLHGALDLNKGCFPGQEFLARINNLGHPANVLARLAYDPDSRPAPGAPVFAGMEGTEEAGAVTSASTLEGVAPGLALASLKWKYREAAELFLGATGARVAAAVELLADYPDRSGGSPLKGIPKP